MSTTLSSIELSKSFIDACLVELRALKPGNVHDYSNGHGMTVADFEAAARAAAPYIVDSSLSLGQRIEKSFEASFKKVKLNANLGIILLAAPLITAAQSSIHVKTTKPTVSDLKSSLKKILNSTTPEDTAAVFRAIKLANPAGLGRVDEADIHHAPPNMTLYEVMLLAKLRDRIAMQYVSTFIDVFELGVKRLRDSVELGLELPWAATNCYLEMVSSFPDSHLVRKHGDDVGKQVQEAGQAIRSWIGSGTGIMQHKATLMDWDKRLKESNLNPGTSADLTVASLLANSLCL
ncbi:MAG: triphosphoribosyl-dephospho-CoA synthase [Candidatus Pacebacteria bacterium]|nr:triphosphoribosyl-dephospho-CoA synthase [Candidatus Paceibacterota bacterium]